MIYVDAICFHGFKYKGRMVRSCHMWGDTRGELDDFASRMHMRPEWVHVDRDGVAHYDLTGSKRSQAVRLGAREVNTLKEAGALIRRLRAEAQKRCGHDDG
jgi:hypothetical protein